MKAGAAACFGTGYLSPSSTAWGQRQGVESERLSETIQVLEKGIKGGREIGAQLYVSLQGKPVLDYAAGAARLDGTPMTTDTLMVWYSATKPLTAICIGQLWEQGKLKLEDPVAKYLPAFAANGKDQVKIKHLLTHTAGFPYADYEYRLDTDFDEMTKKICEAELLWTPGEFSRYHPTSAWHIQGALVAKIDSRPFSQYIREELFLPCGMKDSWVGGMSEATFQQYGDRIGQMVDILPDGNQPADFPGPSLTLQEWCAKCMPGGNGRGPMHDLGKFYEMLMHGGKVGDRQVVTPETIQAMTTPHRVDVLNFESKRKDAPWGYGFKIHAGMGGKFASVKTYGHAGSASSMAFCDPEKQLVMALVFNGRNTKINAARFREATAAVYQDLELV
ncbi:Hypothetical protein PBC10988_16000 [Planctomycetales bacterium 10988]|nr:Hypothetical protein PBC10988_16000 [Planctomycetales bacterium 10988]